MNRPCHASCRSHEARQLRPLRGNGFDECRENDCPLICQRTQWKFTNNSGKQWRIYIEFTMVFAILWASDSSLQTVSIRG
jgi:hypothetical protein